MTIVSSYFGPVLSNKQRNQLVRQAVKDLRPKVNEFDSIAYRGNSGACMAPVLAWIFNKHLIIVRKMAEGQHSGYEVEGKKEVSKVLFVDDFIGQGNTFRCVVDALHKFNAEAHVVAVYTYLRAPTDFCKKKVAPVVFWGRTTEGPGYYAVQE